MGVWNMPCGKSKGPVKKVSAKKQENTVNMHEFLDFIPGLNMDMRNKDTGVYHGQEQEQTMCTLNNIF